MHPRNDYWSSYRAQNQEKIKNYQRTYGEGRRRRAKQRHDHPERELLRKAKARAIRKGVPCTLILSDIQVPSFCPVLGIPLFVKDGKGPGPNSPTIDRIKPGLGYVKENILVVSHRANTIKNDATPDEIQQVANFYRKL